MNLRAQWLLTRIALVAWLSSWFLPVVDGYPGWAAFRAAIEGPFRHTFPTAPEDAIPQVFSALTNIAFPLLCFLLIRNRIKNARLFLRAAIICLVLNLYWLVQLARANELEKLLAGYYLWVAAFALLVVSGTVNVFSGRRTSRTPTAGTPP
ncbi:MAG: hypothetical protein ABI821_01220 [Pseudomonadota bacterium]